LWDMMHEWLAGYVCRTRSPEILLTDVEDDVRLLGRIYIIIERGERKDGSAVFFRCSHEVIDTLDR
jgi:hypothetical protein